MALRFYDCHRHQPRVAQSAMRDIARTSQQAPLPTQAIPLRCGLGTPPRNLGSIRRHHQNGRRMALDSDALEAAIHVLRLTREAIPARWDEDTADELLTLVHLTFHEFVLAVLAEPLPSGTPDEGVPALAIRAAMHGRAIADLLTALALAYSREIGSEPPGATAPAALRQHWIDTIAKAALSEQDRPQHETAVEYVRGVAASLSFIVRILGAERGLSLDPDDPRGPIDPPEDALTGEDAGALLLWCAAAAICISATLQPHFRIQPGE
jgi:hypothetical protein